MRLGEGGIAQQSFCEQQSLSLRKFDRRDSEFSFGDAAQMPIADSERCREICDPATRERMLFDSRYCRTDESRCRVDRRESRRTLGSATQARSIALPLGACGTLEKAQIFTPCGSRRANRPAIDAGCDDCGEKSSVEAPISGAQCAITNVRIKSHTERLANMRGKYSPFSDVYIGIRGVLFSRLLGESLQNQWLAV
jgi:hypothetical protein